MDYRPSSLYKGSIAPNQYQHHHNQDLEWMSRMPSSSNTNTNTDTNISSSRIEILDEEDDGGGDENNNKSVVIEREHMFDKVVTPSDVGKLNRLVIPKQHAEKYFPLDSSTNEKGLLLNFEDRTGKPWRFRYSYWNSSQSYVMTKGWSRFVKEKKLDAGDIVSFQRGVGDVGKDKLFIDWRRRPDATSGLLPYPSSGGTSLYPHHHYHTQGRTIPGMAWGTSSIVLRSHPHPHQPYSYPLGLQGGPSGIWDQQSVPPHHPTPHLSTMSLMNVLPSTQTHHHPDRRGMGLGSGGGYGFGFGNVVNPTTYPVIFLRPTSTTTTNGGFSLSSSEEDQQRGIGLGLGLGSGSSPLMMVHGNEGGEESMVYESVPVVQGKAAAKRLRLFGVNMDCPISHQTHDFDILSSSLASSSTLNHHPRHQQNDKHVSILMGPPSSPPPHQQLPSPFSSSSSSPSPLLFYNGTSSSSVPLEKGKSSTSSSMSLDLDI